VRWRALEDRVGEHDDAADDHGESREHHRAETDAAMQMFGGGAALAIVALATGELRSFDVSVVTRDSWLAWGYLLVIALVGFPVYTWLLEHGTPARVSTCPYVNPVVAVFPGWLIPDEPIGTRTLVSATIIVAAVVLIKLPESRKGRAARRATSPHFGQATVRPITAVSGFACRRRQAHAGGTPRGVNPIGVVTRRRAG
jgi:hypothetical protein